jgi:hypothetical protein
MKHIPLHRIPHALSGLTAGVLALTISALALIPSEPTQANSPPANPVFRQVRERAKRADTKSVRTRRDYYQALDIYHQLFQGGREDLQKPDRNDPESIMYYLNGLYEEMKSASSSSARATVVSAESLEDRERELLRFYLHTRYCPEGLADTSPGFYELCRKLIGRKQRSSAPQGLMNQDQRRNLDRIERDSPTDN